MLKINALCVYCGSSTGRHSEYTDGAERLGRLLAARNIHLIYGGAGIGLMGVLAETVLARGGQVTGVIPDDLFRREVAHTGLTDLQVVSSMHERKARMADLADGFIALPGGLGTFEELFEVLTWAQLGLHQKPCGLLNINGYYGRLSAFLDHSVAEGFVKSKHRSMLMMDSDAERLLKRLELYEAPHDGKWIHKESR